MKILTRKLFAFALTLIMVLTLMPVGNVKAEETGVTVTTEKELRDAVANGGTIILGGYITVGGDMMNLTEDILKTPLEIRKDTTIILGDYGLYYAFAMGNGQEQAYSLFDVADCTLTIKANGFAGIIFNGPEGCVIKAHNISGNTKVVVEGGSYNLSAAGSVFEVSSADGYTTDIVINDGYFSKGSNPQTGADNEKLFATDGKDSTKITINGGDFTCTKEEITPYLGADTEILAIGDSMVNVVSSIWSDEFSALAEDGTIYVPFLNKYDASSDWPQYEIQGMLDVYLGSFSSNDGFYMSTFYDDPSTAIIYRHDNEGAMLEAHNVKIVYLDSVDPTINAQVMKYIDELSALNEGRTYLMKDMEVINFWVRGFDPYKYDYKMTRDMPNFSGELKSWMGNSNISIGYYPGAGMDMELLNLAAGDSVFIHDGIYYGICSNAWVQAQNIIYVPDGTGASDAELIAAAQARIDEYLGESGKVVVSAGGNIADLRDPWDPNYTDYYLDMIAELELANPKLDLTGVDKYFVAKVGDIEHKMLIIPDSEQMIVPTYKTADLTTNIEISSTASEVPLDTVIKAEPLTSGETYDNVVKTLGVEENLTYDLKLYSNSTNDYISKLSSGEFQVKVPLPDGWDKKDLGVYYIEDNGDVTPYDAALIEEPNGKFYVSFNTNHFSVYTITEKIPMACSVNGINHKLTAVPAKAATTTAEGNKAYWICDCGKMFEDAEGKVEITDKTSVVIPKLQPEDTTTENTTTESTTAESTTTETVEPPKKPAEPSPATGDNTNVVLLIMLMLMSTAVIIKFRKTEIE